MRLWKKISIITIVILLAVVVTCSTLLLLQAKDSMIQLTTEQAQTEQRNLSTSFSEMVQYYLDNESKPVVKQSGINYCFKRLAGNSSVLIGGDGTIYSAVSVKPEKILPIDSSHEQRTSLEKIEGRNILIVGSGLILLNDSYSVYIVKDVTGIFNNIAAMTWRFVLICGIGVIAGTLLIILFVRKASKPLISLQDITRRIAVGEYDKRAQIQSKDEVGGLARDFNAMADAVQSHISDLEDTAKRQQLFIGGLTHEFKTPMTSMIIHSDTLLSADLSKEEAQNSLIHIHAQCRWLERLTQKLLKLITLEEDIRIQPENIKRLFDDIIESTAEAMRERNTPLKSECNLETLKMDYDLMKSLLINLIDNASKASEPGQPIALRAYGNTLEVQDNGKGIPQGDIERITDPFYMVDRSRSKKNGGSGLGMALVKRIADAHDARLVIDSQTNVGTTMKIIFPGNPSS
ncbi:MAG TPA: HAMP domain-containing histidine kinase [Clostridiales bacterium]|nr:HAMP domain-containing histidine kinase [Clostridiales bacterium]